MTDNIKFTYDINFYISILTGVFLPAIIAFVTVLLTRKSERGKNVLAVTTSVRIQRNDQLKEAGIMLITNTDPRLLSRTSAPTLEMLCNATKAKTSIGVLLHRNFENDKKIIELSEQIVTLAFQIVDATSSNQIAMLMSEMDQLQSMFSYELDLYTYTEWQRIKKETSGKETVSKDWIVLNENIRGQYPQEKFWHKNTVDLHTHTNCSDGNLTPEEVMDNAAKAGLQIIAVSDHDTIDGVLKLQNVQNEGLCKINAVELTTALLKVSPIMQPLSLHILGYGIDPYNADLNDYLEKVQERKSAYIDDFMNDFSFMLSENAPSEIPILHGVMLQYADLRDYVLKYVQQKYRLDAEQKLMMYAHQWNSIWGSAQDAIDVIHKAGGIAVWAHPFITYKNSQRMDLSYSQIRKILKKLILYRIDGIESFYLTFTREQTTFLEKCASKYNLLQSAGSDYHGYKGRTNFHCMDANRIVPLLERLEVEISED